MAFVLADRVKESCAAPGTGTVTLLGAATGYQSFSAGIGANNTTYYTIADQGGANWEVGYGTIGAGGTTLARTTVLASSNSGSLVNFSSGTQDVFCDYPATKAALADSANALRVDGQSYVNFQSATGTTVAAGRMWYDNAEGNWNLGMGGGNITQQVGEELFVYGKASSAITDSPLQIVYQTGVVGASGHIEFAPTVAGITNGNLILGCATEPITVGNFGRITTYGTIHGITTNGTAYGETWADGDVIWYNPTTGNPTKTKPTAPNIKVQLGIVTHAGSGGSGSFFVLVQVGTELGGTDSNVNISSPTGGQILIYDQTNQYWKNTNLSAGTGISVTPTTGGTLTVANTGVTSVTGTSPVVSSGGTTPAISMPAATSSVNGYLTSADWTTFNSKQPAGTYVTSVAATSPVTSTGGTTPTIAMPAATTSVSGYLTSTDWNTFNNKGNGTVTSVTATSPVTSTGGTTPVIAMPAASASVNGYLTSTDWSTFNGKGTGTVTSVSALTLGTTGTDLSSTVANGTTTPVITLNVPTASATNRGALSAADWTTFNNKASSFTYTTNYVPYGQGTTTPNQSSSYTFDGTTQTAPIQRASNGILVNSKTVSASYTIASTDNAVSAGPVTVASGQTVTVSSGSRWVVL